MRKIFRLEHTLILIICVFTSVSIRQAKACEPLVNPPFELDPNEEQVDDTPPQTPEVEVKHIRRGKGPSDEIGCVKSASPCDNLGTIVIAVLSAEDDRTTFDKIGIRIDLAEGDLPKRAKLYDTDVTILNGYIYLQWDDKAKDEQESIDFSLNLRAVDLAGNVSEVAAVIDIVHPGRGGCSTGKSGINLFPLILVALIAKRMKSKPPSCINPQDLKAEIS